MQRIRLDHSSTKRRWMVRDEFNSFIKVITMERKTVSLPEGAPRYIFHPDWHVLYFWDIIMIILSCFYFWELPFSIAFDAAHRLRAPHLLLPHG